LFASTSGAPRTIHPARDAQAFVESIRQEARFLVVLAKTATNMSAAERSALESAMVDAAKKYQ